MTHFFQISSSSRNRVRVVVKFAAAERDGRVRELLLVVSAEIVCFNLASAGLTF